MDKAYETGYPAHPHPQDVKNSENDKLGLARGVSFDIPKPSQSWTWWQIISGKRDEAQGFRGRGWITSPFVYLGQYGESVASFALEFNIINYFLLVLNIPLATAISMTTMFVGGSYCSPLAGAFIADAYLGRFLTFVLGSFISLGGMVMFAIQALDMFRLLPEECPFLINCEQLNIRQLSFLWVSLVILAVGSGVAKPCAAPFGADQFDRSKRNYVSELRHFFNWYYFTVAFAMVTALIFIIYIQDSKSFGWGAVTSIIFLAMASFFFLCGSPFYIHRPPTGSPLTKLFQVAVAAVRKWKRSVPENPDNLYEDHQLDDKEASKEDLGVRLELLKHTDGFRFLDKAAILEEAKEEPDWRRRFSPWRLAPVHRVEELKTMLRILPIWLATVPVSLVTVQRGTFVNQQALTMDRSFGTMQIPSASVIVFSIAPLLIFIPFYDFVVVKMLRKVTGHPKGISDLQRIGVGTAINVLTSIVTVFIEKKRRNVAFQSGMEQLPLGIPGKVLPISAMWLVPQLVLMGLAEVFVVIGQIEFYYDQAPESLRSMSNALFWFSLGIGSFLNSFVIVTIQGLTSHDCLKPLPNGGPAPCGWIENNFGLGHLDYFFWFVAVITVLNFIYFLAVSHWYVYKKRATDFPVDDEPSVKSLPANEPSPKA